MSKYVQEEFFMLAGIIIVAFIGGLLGVAFMCLLFFSRS